VALQQKRKHIVLLVLIVDDSKCENFSGADIHALVRESSVIALKRNFFASETFYSVSEGNLDKEFDQMSVDSNETTKPIVVTMNDFLDALKKIKPSVSNRDRLKYDRLNKKMGWIEEEKGDQNDTENTPAPVDI